MRAKLGFLTPAGGRRADELLQLGWYTVRTMQVGQAVFRLLHGTPSAAEDIPGLVTAVRGNAPWDWADVADVLDARRDRLPGPLRTRIPEVADRMLEASFEDTDPETGEPITVRVPRDEVPAGAMVLEDDLPPHFWMGHS